MSGGYAGVIMAPSVLPVKPTHVIWLTRGGKGSRQRKAVMNPPLNSPGVLLKWERSKCRSSGIAGGRSREVMI